uniref:DNA polymerase n=1 Tax=Fomes fomentarius TaxID=40442 RepID=UPI00300313BD|nr:DNA polymerase [Fomes fomentarius]
MSYLFIKKGWGQVDVYIPYGKKVYWYDVNSLYPYIMRNQPMLHKSFIEGDELLIKDILNDNTKFSFIEVGVPTI